MKIISLVPSSTYTVAMCPELKSQLLGCTKFCIEPKGLAREITLIGGTKDPDINLIQSLKPSHILANDEENKPEHINQLKEIAAVHSDLPKSPEDVITMFSEMKNFLGAKSYFDDLVARLEHSLASIKSQQDWQASGLRPGLKYLYLIWREPYMIVSQDTYISRFLEILSWQNVCPPTHADIRYPEISLEQMIAVNPDMILLSSEPYPFRKRDGLRLKSEWESLGANLPPIWKIDGQLCSWHGLKTLEGIEAAQILIEKGKFMPLLKLLYPMSESAP